MEIWKDIPGYEGLYQVSDIGRVKSLARLDMQGRRIQEKIMKPNPHHKGYLKVPLRKQGIRKDKFIHCLVISAFVGVSSKESQVNHKNGNKADNRLENLEYCTASYNIIHSHRVLGKKSNLQGEKHWAAKLTKSDVVKIRELYATGEYTHKSLAILFNIQAPAIGKIINRQHWAHV